MNTKSYTASSEFPPLSPGTMRLYNMRFCPYSQRTLLVLAHKNIKHETINIDLSHKPSWFLDRNPNGTVPILEQDGKVLYESLVTADYLDDLYPDNKLTPSDPYQKALDKLIVELYTKVTPCYYSFFGEGTSKEHAEKFLSALDKVEKACAQRGTKFFGGNSVAMVDLMIWTHTERFEALAQLFPDTKLTPERFPKFLQWIQNMGTVPAVQKYRWDTPTHAHFIKSAREKKPDYDYGL